MPGSWTTFNAPDTSSGTFNADLRRRLPELSACPPPGIAAHQDHLPRQGELTALFAESGLSNKRSGTALHGHRPPLPPVRRIQFAAHGADSDTLRAA